ncbi:MAG: hypothetical protein WBW81_03925 [Methylocella sp.]
MGMIEGAVGMINETLYDITCRIDIRGNHLRVEGDHPLAAISAREKLTPQNRFCVRLKYPASGRQAEISSQWASGYS